MSSVDVIVPCYRYGHFLRECVESVLRQSGPDIRVLIIDDASPDNTAEIARALAEADPRVTVRRHVSNSGHIATYNEGILWASADYLIILSADDYLLPGALNRATKLMDVHPEVCFIFGAFIEATECGLHGDGGPVAHILDGADWKIVPGAEFITFNGSDNIVSTPTAVVRTNVQKRVGGYRHELPHTGDMEMWLRLAAYGSVGVIGTQQAVYRRHGGNMSHTYMVRNWLPDLEQRKLAFECFFETCCPRLPNPARLQRTLRLSLSCRAVGFASTAFNEGSMEICEQLMRFAVDVCPQVKRSLTWHKLVCKRILGLKASNLLSAVMRNSHALGQR